jgi:hypothetical protein
LAVNGEISRAKEQNVRGDSSADLQHSQPEPPVEIGTSPRHDEASDVLMSAHAAIDGLNPGHESSFQ